MDPLAAIRQNWEESVSSVEGRRPYWATFTIILFGVGSIVSYVMLSLVTNSQPPTSPNTGWVALLQRQEQPWKGQISLEATAVVPGAPGDHPSLTYSVIACGNQPFEGILLLGGPAQLDDIVVTDQYLVTNADATQNAPRVSTISDLVLGFQDAVWHLGSVQKIPIVIDNVDPCVVDQAGREQLLVGTGTDASGHAQGPVQRTGNFLGIDGPRTIQAWPLIGGLPSAPPNVVGSFSGLDGLEGKWTIPPTLGKKISSGSLTARATVDGAIPSLADSSKILWEGNQPFRASARVTNIEDLERWQNWLMASGIVLGVGASLLAALLFEWLRPPREANALVSPASMSPSAKQETSALDSPSSRSEAVLAFATLGLAAYLLGRRGRRRHKRDSLPNGRF